DPDKTNKRDFKIEDEQLIIPLQSRLQQKLVAKECSEWIEQKVNIKSMVKPDFLHGKMYHIRNSNETQKAIFGSSNFTVSGLGLGNNPNIELNMEIDSERDRNDLLNWFNEIWNDDTGLVEDVKDEVLKYLAQLYQENSPSFIYYKTLYHLFGDYLVEQQGGGLLDERIGFFDTQVWNMLFDFQKDGVKGAINKILKHSGCIIADSVGLGKTFEALAVIKYFELLNHRVLVLCPKKLRENWDVYRRNDTLNSLVDDHFAYDVLCHTDLTRDQGYSANINLATINWSNYGLVVIDESHNFKNDAEGKKDENGQLKYSRYGQLINEIIKKGVPTRVLLLSATPVNNNLKDLRNQIYLITKGENNALAETVGIKDISQTMKNAQTQFNNWADRKKNAQREARSLLEKLDSSFFKLLDELTIARSRKHIIDFYDISKVGKFPDRRKPISLSPGIDLKKEFPSYDQLNKEISEYKLSLFKPSDYIKDAFQEDYRKQELESGFNFRQAQREDYLIGMMKVNFLKRLESSIDSFRISMDRTIRKIEDLEGRIKEYQDCADDSDTLEERLTALPDDEQDEDIVEANEKWQVGKKLKYHLGHLKLDKWLKDLQRDKAQLEYLYKVSNKVSVKRDEKLALLKKIIQEKVSHPINSWVEPDNVEVPNKKIIVFTAFADTAYYLYDALLDWVTNDLKLHIAVVTGGNRNNQTSFMPKGYKNQSDFNQILTNFSPVAKGRSKMPKMPQDDEIDILIATDCISEGQNLQDADCLINYDIHWNPVRIIQRFGRIDRIGSRNQSIQLINFWPTDDLNKYINLKDRVEARMALVDITATGDDNLLDPGQIENLIEADLSYRDKQLLKLKDEVLDLEDMDENISLSEFTLDDFRIELLNFIKENERILREAPLGLYANVPSPAAEYAHLTDYSRIDSKSVTIMKPGVIFCLKQSSDKRENEAVNPLQPYFLIYMQNNGVLRFNYNHAKQILEVYRILCSGRSNPYDVLCTLFDDETSSGTNMDKYNKLLKQSIAELLKMFKKRNLRQLQSGRSGILVSQEAQPDSAEAYEMVT
ncbi:MAG: helicase-related protein, partial [Syntrophomonas sp.]|nr:helicase-related protein [Syntrophomonas sp.]